MKKKRNHIALSLSYRHMNNQGRKRPVTAVPPVQVVQNDDETVKRMTTSLRENMENLDDFLDRTRYENDFILAFIEPREGALPQKKEYIAQFVEWTLEEFPQSNRAIEEKKTLFYSDLCVETFNWFINTKDPIEQIAFLFFSLCIVNKVFTFFVQEQEIVKSHLPRPKIPDRVRFKQFILNHAKEECTQMLRNNCRSPGATGRFLGKFVTTESSFQTFIGNCICKYITCMGFYICTPDVYFGAIEERKERNAKRKKNVSNINTNVTYDP